MLLFGQEVLLAVRAEQFRTAVNTIRMNCLVEAFAFSANFELAADGPPDGFVECFGHSFVLLETTFPMKVTIAVFTMQIAPSIAAIAQTTVAAFLTAMMRTIVVSLHTGKAIVGPFEETRHRLDQIEVVGMMEQNYLLLLVWALIDDAVAESCGDNDYLILAESSLELRDVVESVLTFWQSGSLDEFIGLSCL